MNLYKLPVLATLTIFCLTFSFNCSAAPVQAEIKNSDSLSYEEDYQEQHRKELTAKRLNWLKNAALIAGGAIAGGLASALASNLDANPSDKAEAHSLSSENKTLK